MNYNSSDWWLHTLMSFSTGEYKEREIKRRSKFGGNKLNFHNRKWEILIWKDSVSLNKWNTNSDAQNKKLQFLVFNYTFASINYHSKKRSRAVDGKRFLKSNASSILGTLT